MNKTQQDKVIELFKSGVNTYTEISKRLDLPYNQVNLFMTKWKRKNGLLKKHEDIYKMSKLESEIAEELEFLRKFYVKNTMH
jgi:predicted transcriptional regulator